MHSVSHIESDGGRRARLHRPDRTNPCVVVKEDSWWEAPMDTNQILDDLWRIALYKEMLPSLSPRLYCPQRQGYAGWDGERSMPFIITNIRCLRGSRHY